MSDVRIKVPALKGESNLEAWDTMLFRALQVQGLHQYIKDGVPEPAIEGEKVQWNKDRGMVGYIIGYTLLDPEISGALKNNG
ncbi:hypothetical protein B0H67DRAFT_478360 [Lasiosphaeris hirsuta]|uniref:Uncharacterized protein n=1 Tax=Lasiosphaeris hirsuta TaxID=260670 RepID=A0AA40BCZ1_9PEZI|nr:hypothetical protein B0H67DRAFT_478360 [Lasiosphaeris hirsuta]